MVDASDEGLNLGAHQMAITRVLTGLLGVSALTIVLSLGAAGWSSAAEAETVAIDEVRPVDAAPAAESPQPGSGEQVQPEEVLPEDSVPQPVVPREILTVDTRPQTQRPVGPVDAIRSRVDVIGEVGGNTAGKVLLTEGDMVSLWLDPAANPQPKQVLTIVRADQRVKHPTSHRRMGRLVRIVGMVELLEPFGKYWCGRIVSSHDYTVAGDLVMAPGSDEESHVPAVVAEDRSGYVVAVPYNEVLTGAYEVIHTDLGRERGVEAGQIFSIVREGSRGRLGGPPRKIGEGRVVAVSTASSSVYITRSFEPIQVGDRLEPVANKALE
jgi:hypothetical protein